MNLYEYVGSSPVLAYDPMGLANAAIDREVQTNAEFIRKVMEGVRSGEIAPERASRLLDDNMHGTLKNIEIHRKVTDSFANKISTSGKAVANGLTDTAASTVSLGFWQPGEVWKTNEYNHAAGYDWAYGSVRVTSELAVGIATGAAAKAPGLIGKGVLAVDALGNASNVGRGVWDAADCGLNWSNGLQIAAGAAGLGGNVSGVLAKAKNELNVLGRGSTADWSKGTTLPRNLREQLAIQQAARNPAAGKKIGFAMTDPRWPGTQGWEKLQQVITPGGDSINVHYLYNSVSKQIDDFKIVIPGAR